MRHLLYIIVISCVSLTSCSNKSDNRPSKRNETMIIYNPKDNPEAAKLAKQLELKGISDKLVLKAIATVPRHEFVDINLREYAYLDRPLPIDRDQTISQPYTVAYQSELLELKPGEKVLEIGTGSGYQAAILCEMGAEVYSIERYEVLHNNSKKKLNSLGYYPNLYFGDGYEGLLEHAPFDKFFDYSSTRENT